MQPIIIATLILLLCWNLYLSVRILKIYRIFEKLTKVSDQPLLGVLNKILRSKEKVESEIADLYQNIERIDRQKARSLQHLGIVSYNVSGSFQNQSFSLSMLDSVGNGVVITHLVYAQTSKTYVKDVVRARVNGRFTPEEKESVKKALSSIQK